MSGLGEQIWKAIETGNEEELARLLNGGVDPNVFRYESDYSNWGNMTALGLASVKADTEMVNMLVQAGANVNYQESDGGCTALMWATIFGRTATAQALLQLGAKVNLQQGSGWTALMFAANYDRLELVWLLLEWGADKNLQDKDGRTAADLPQTEEIRTLINTHVLSGTLPASSSAAAVEGAADGDRTTAGEQDLISNKPATPTASTTSTTATAPQAPDQAAGKVTDPSESVKKALMAEVLAAGSKPWGRGKWSLLGQGRAGKTALARAVIDKEFEETASTVGINQLTCDVKHIQVGSGAAGAGAGAGGQEQQVWGECEKPQREYEGAVASGMLAAARAAARAAQANRHAGREKGEDIRASLQKSAKPSPSTGRDVGEGAGREVTTSTPSRSAPAAVPSSTFTSSQASPQPQPQPMPSVDEETVMKELAKLQDTSTGLLISLFDFGGQAVFDVIHHLFLTRNGVYALMFNMEWLVSDGPDKVTALSFMRKWLSSITAHTLREGRTAPIVIVGTRLDTVSDPAVHERISTILYDELHDSLAWPSVIKNDSGKDRNGRAEQVFFPVDNKLGKKGASMQRLMSVVYGAMDKAEYTHKEVPLTWFKATDQMSDTKKDCLSLSEVVTMLSGCGVSEAEVPLLLSFLYDMGHLMWLDEPGLRDVVILDPVSYLVTPATIIICKLEPDHIDGTYHHMEVHAECQVKHRWEFDELVSRGVLSVKLLPILWKQYQQHTATLLQLMVKFGLLVPLRSDMNGPPSQFLVPSLLPLDKEGYKDQEDWVQGSTDTFFLVFTLRDQLASKSGLTSADLVRHGFLPGGMFERIVGEALAWCQDTSAGAQLDLENDLILRKDVAILSFGQQWFRLVRCSDIHCVRVEVEGRNPVGIQNRLVDLVQCMAGHFRVQLRCFTAIPLQAASATSPPVLIPLEKLRSAVAKKSKLSLPNRESLTVENALSYYAQWLPMYRIPEHFDVFISCSVGEDDLTFSLKLFDTFTNHSAGKIKRAVQVFLADKRLADGDSALAAPVRALAHSRIAVPVVSIDGLCRMLRLENPGTVDPVMLDWILVLELARTGAPRAVFPVLIGEIIASDLSAPDDSIVCDFRECLNALSLSVVAPTATLALAKELLQANGIQPSEKMQSYTVHSVVQELLQYTACEAHHHCLRHLPAVCAERTCALLNNYDEAILAADPAKFRVAPTNKEAVNVIAGADASALQAQLAQLFLEIQGGRSDLAQVLGDVQSGTSTILKEIQGGRTDLSRVIGEVQAGRIETFTVLGELGKVRAELSQVLHHSHAANNMLRTLIGGTHDIPTLAVVFPVSKGWLNALSPLRLVRKQYRLFFLCAHTYRPVRCGPEGKGFTINLTREWVIKARPVLQVGLVMLKVALLASGIPLPIPDLANVLPTTELKVKYLHTVFKLLSNPPDDIGFTDHVIDQALEGCVEMDLKDLALDKSALHSYCTLKALLPTDEHGFLLQTGLRKVTDANGRTAWVEDSDAAEAAWREASSQVVFADMVKPGSEATATATVVTGSTGGRRSRPGSSTGGGPKVTTPRSRTADV